LTSEPESHSHRTDQEWRAIIRDWIGKLKLYPETASQDYEKILLEMERITDEH